MVGGAHPTEPLPDVTLIRPFGPPSPVGRREEGVGLPWGGKGRGRWTVVPTLGECLGFRPGLDAEFDDREVVFEGLAGGDFADVR